MTLGERMKCYEGVSRHYLMRKTPVIIRLDGRAFHSFTKKLNRPFDNFLNDAMTKTMRYLCENVGNCVLGYSQSDEISLLLVDYADNKTQPWFDNNINKLVSLTASMATLYFNKVWMEQLEEPEKYTELWDEYEGLRNLSIYESKCFGAMFDSRVFNLPLNEVCNYFIWRQQDATRNSIQMVGQANFSHKELHKKNTSNIQDMLMEKGINWNDTPTHFKRGACCKRVVVDEATGRRKWEIDKEIPIFTQDRTYIEKLVKCEV